jgi:hypothetical protein
VGISLFVNAKYAVEIASSPKRFRGSVKHYCAYCFRSMLDMAFASSYFDLDCFTAVVGMLKQEPTPPFASALGPGELFSKA